MAQGFGTGTEPSNETRLVNGTLRGYRKFEISFDGLLKKPTLKALVKNETYEPRKDLYLARCRDEGASAHDTPHKHCACGFWSYYEPSFTVGYSGKLAVVELSGRVILGEHGSRAEKMRILGIVDAPKTAKRYGIDFFRTQPELIAAYPPEDVSNLLPEKPEPPPRTGGDYSITISPELFLNNDGYRTDTRMRWTWTVQRRGCPVGPIQGIAWDESDALKRAQDYCEKLDSMPGPQIYQYRARGRQQ